MISKDEFSGDDTMAAQNGRKYDRHMARTTEKTEH